ncbi:MULTISPECIES: LysE family translocator [Mammaliicoccus]|uniref:LysE family translocator n=1 Tax=Mammaliicoccus lentus TaxID=42858 RepID=A0ABS6GZI0_MAMLE|nr:LysE family translocator [Mammaliicoccus lentus]MBF0748461.1 LysE family translocator [Mammaliicoccus lentus]MBF0841920.1 LysE family translocator [Mammaliicoccus lentus]MBU6114870.1 LysE family translocator [Mammaliicoccus lentus]TFU58967.1 LysE family translocator [Mammaliicoccus lentus]
MDNWLSFIVISLMIIIIPGPDFFIVLNNTLKGNAKNGIMAGLGISSAHVFYSALAAFGLIFILTTSYYVFTVIKILGSIYIAYLGIKTILNAKKAFNISTDKDIKTDMKLRLSYKQGFISTIFNPKAILFYVSILPQFITKEDGSMQILVLSSLFILTVFIWFFLCSFLFNYIRQIFNNVKIKSMLDYAIGTVLIGLAISIFRLEK